LKNLEGFTQPLGERGDELISKVDRGFERLDVLLAEFAELGKALNNPNGSLGQLLNKPDLYQHINQAAENIDYLTRELRPILRDARVFTDKIARHPEELGVRGALHPSSGLK
jgi:phospholipid/cholesterol/gamma-HCH transport system substrate-binding protein